MAVGAAAQPATDRGVECTAALTRLFAPADPDDADTYQVCRSTYPIDELIEDGWSNEMLVAADAFAGAAPSVKRAAALLYGGRLLQVVRGRHAAPGPAEAITLISPQPDTALTQLIPGTLIIRTRLRR